MEKALRVITDNFEKGFNQTTLMGWRKDFDLEGRPLNADPNYRSGSCRIEEKDYWYVRKGWKVRVWDVEADYHAFMNGDKSYILEIDLTPEYIKNDKLD